MKDQELISKMDKTIASLSEELQRARRDFEQAEVSRRTNADLLTAAQQEIERLKEQVSRSSYVKCLTRENELYDRLASLQSQLDATNAERDSLNTEVKCIQQISRENEALFHKVKAESDALRDENAKLKEQLANMKRALLSPRSNY